MTDCRDRPTIPSTASIFNKYADRLRTEMLQCYLTPLSLIDQLRARRELKIVKSIRRKLAKYHLVLRQTDKSGVLHIGRKNDYKEKAAKYRQDTGAYEELTSNPFDHVFLSVVQLIQKLKAEKKIKDSHVKKMEPKRMKTKLAYMYFLPKPHKVCLHRYVSVLSTKIRNMYRKEHHFDRSSIRYMQQPLVFRNS